MTVLYFHDYKLALIYEFCEKANDIFARYWTLNCEQSEGNNQNCISSKVFRYLMFPTGRL